MSVYENYDDEFDELWMEINLINARLDKLEALKQSPKLEAKSDTFWGSQCNCDVEYMGGHFSHCPEKKRR